MKKKNENLLILAAAAGITALSCAIAEVIASSVRAKRNDAEEFAEPEDFQAAGEGTVEEAAEEGTVEGAAAEPEAPAEAAAEAE